MKIIIYGKPQHKRRHRTARRGDYAIQYDPKENKEAETTIQAIAMQQRPEKLMEGMLIANITAFFPIPRSISRKKREDMINGKIRPTIKPDCDNIAKIYFDALNGIIYHDDKQIVTAIIQKRYSETPHVVIEIKEYSPITYGGENEDKLLPTRSRIATADNNRGKTMRQLPFLERTETK